MNLYVHIPFCDRKCFYCSFVSVVGQEKQIDDYLHCIKKEISNYQPDQLDTIYVGGGTPSVLHDQQIDLLNEIIQGIFQKKGDCEYTFEVNPESITPSKAKTLKRQGVNRISLGIQSFDDDYLKYLGRNHTSRQALESYETLREAGFQNINVDIIYGFENQSREDLMEGLKNIIRLNSEHVSLYSLSIEKNSRFYVKKENLKNSQEQKNQYQLVADTLKEAGFRQYEISNFSRPDQESRHNINCWQCGNYIGLGVSAHSHMNGKRYWNVSRLKSYLSLMHNGQSPIEGFEDLTYDQQLKEALLFGMRMNDGVDIGVLENRFESKISVEDNAKIQQFQDNKLLVLENGNLRATEKGRLVLDEICSQLL